MHDDDDDDDDDDDYNDDNTTDDDNEINHITTLKTLFYQELLHRFSQKSL